MGTAVGELNIQHAPRDSSPEPAIQVLMDISLFSQGCHAPNLLLRQASVKHSPGLLTFIILTCGLPRILEPTVESGGHAGGADLGELSCTGSVRAENNAVSSRQTPCPECPWKLLRLKHVCVLI